MSPPSESVAQVEQDIGFTPDCGFDGTLQSQTIWSAPCAKCTVVGGDGSFTPGAFGRKGNLHERCCYNEGGCGGWKLICLVCRPHELS